MTRVFTKNLGRWKQGDIREYPIPTWQQIERGAKSTMDSFSKELVDAAKTMIMESPITASQRPMNRKVV